VSSFVLQFSAIFGNRWQSWQFLLRPSACVPQPDTHPPIRRFIENKSQSAI
jgi:hypothetical protein